VTLRTEPVSFDAKLPLGAEGLSSLISSIALTVDDDWAPDTNKAKVGDAFTHGITLCADGVPGMAFPALPEVHVDDRVSAAFANCRDGPKRARPSLDTLIRCLRKYVESNPRRFRIVDNSGKSHRICIVMLRDPVEPL
jgi:hypothetical protein